MKPITRLILTCCLTILLLACDTSPDTDQQAAVPAAPVEPADVTTTPAAVVGATSLPMPEAGKHVIDLYPEKVSIRANQVNERELLNELATLANFQLLTGDIDWQVVSVDIQTESLRAALVELLQGYPYQIVYAPDRDNRQEVLSEVVIAELPDAGMTNSTETDTADKAPFNDIEDPSEDGQQQAYIQALQSPKAEVRAAATVEVEPVGDAFYLLTDMLVKDPSPEVRIATSETLEESDDPLAIQALVKCLQDENPAVIVACIQALDFLGDETTVQHLEPLLTHYDPNVNAAAAEAIEALQ